MLKSIDSFNAKSSVDVSSIPAGSDHSRSRLQAKVAVGEEDKPLNFLCVLFESVIAGCTFGVVVEAAFYPINTIKTRLQPLVANEEFQHILRVLKTDVNGKQKIMFALTSIKGIGRLFANIVCKKADVDMNKRSLALP